MPRVFGWQKEEPSRDEGGRFLPDEESKPLGSADGGARGVEQGSEPPSLSDLFRAAMMEKNASRSGWARLAQRERQAEEK